MVRTVKANSEFDLTGDSAAEILQLIRLKERADEMSKLGIDYEGLTAEDKLILSLKGYRSIRTKAINEYMRITGCGFKNALDWMEERKAEYHKIVDELEKKQ